jgi:aminoglycoside phosphotransferase (APT) family kinase protein
VHQFSHGQSNPTYLLELGGGNGRRLVLRKKPPGRLLSSAHAVEREYRVLCALAGSTVPVAAPVALCSDESVLGTPFYVMDFAGELGVAGENKGILHSHQ